MSIMKKCKDLVMTMFFENIKLVSTVSITYHGMTNFQTGKNFD
jgi:hypothetical protein